MARGKNNLWDIYTEEQLIEKLFNILKENRLASTTEFKNMGIPSAGYYYNLLKLKDYKIKTFYEYFDLEYKKPKNPHLKEKYNEVKKYIEQYNCKLLSSEYVDNHKNLLIECPCGNQYFRAFSIFKGTPKRKGVHCCPSCNGITINTYESVKSNLKKYDIILHETEYTNQDTKIKVEYKCGHKCNRTYANIIKSKYECPQCKKNGYNRDTNQLKKEIHDITNGEYELMSEFTKMIDKVTIKHNKCGYIYKTTPHTFLDNGCRCPQCNQSKHEIFIKTYLTNSNINFEEQYIFDDLVSDYDVPLRFDFCIFDNKVNIEYLLEYDGEFHYLPIKGEIELKKQKRRDSLKDKYCINKDIKLIRIPYWESKNIENILNDILIDGNKNNEFIINR